MSAPRNPNHESAMTIYDVCPDASFVVLKAGQVVMRGIFTGNTDYTEEGGWFDIAARMEDGNETQISPYAIGIVCQPNGRWPEDMFVLNEADFK